MLRAYWRKASQEEKSLLSSSSFCGSVAASTSALVFVEPDSLPPIVRRALRSLMLERAACHAAFVSKDSSEREPRKL